MRLGNEFCIVFPRCLCCQGVFFELVQRLICQLKCIIASRTGAMAIVDVAISRTEVAVLRFLV